MKKHEPVVSVTEEIRKLPVLILLEMEFSTLDAIEKMLQEEARRTHLAIKWMRGIKCIKQASNDGGRNG